MWLAVDLAQRFVGITVANGPLQECYGGMKGFGVALTRTRQGVEPAG